jgi:hypothetical protein
LGAPYEAFFQFYLIIGHKHLVWLIFVDLRSARLSGRGHCAFARFSGANYEIALIPSFEIEGRVRSPSVPNLDLSTINYPVTP